MSDYEIGVMSAAVLDDGLDKGISKIADNGFSHIELSAEQFEDFSKMNDDGFGRLNDLRTSRGLTYSVHGPLSGLNIGSGIDGNLTGLSGRKSSVERLKWYIDAAAAVGSDILVLHPVPVERVRVSFSTMRKIFLNLHENQIYGLASETIFGLRNEFRKIGGATEARRVVKSIMESYSLAAEKRVSISPENTSGYFSDSQSFGFIVDYDLPYLNFTYDPVHATKPGKKGSDWFGALAGKINHVHVHETNGVSAHLPITGRGGIDWPKFLRRLHEIHYSGNLIVENYDLDDAVKSRKYLESIM